MKKGGLTAELVEAKLHEHMGNFASVARFFGVTRQAVHDFVRRRPKLAAIANDVREAMKDNVESKLYTDCLKDDAAYQTSRIFFLKTQGKDRGYADLHQHEHKGEGGGPVIIRIVEEVVTRDGTGNETNPPAPGATSVSEE